MTATAEPTAASLLDLFDPAQYRYDPAALPHFGAAAVIAITAAMILRWERGSRISLMFGGFSVLFVVWAISHGLFLLITQPALLLYVAARAYVVAAVAIPLLAHFVLLLIHRDADCRTAIWLNWILGFLFAVLARDTPLVVSGLRQMPWGLAPVHGWVGTAMLVWIAGVISFVSFHFVQALRRAAPASVERKRLTILAVATAILYLSAIDFLNGEGLEIYPLGSAAVLVFTTLSAYATWKYGLVEVNAQLVARQIADMMRGAVLILDRENVIRFANDAATRILGLARSQLMGSAASRLLGEAFSDSNLAALARSEGGHVEKDCLYREPDSGRIHDLVLSAVAVRDAHEREIAYVCLARDTTEQKRLEKEQARERVTDALTGLPNRAMFLGVLDAAAERCQAEPGYSYAVCFVGMDRMRVVNEDLGYAAGDALLREVAERLRRASRPQDSVARVGGDEFAVLVRGLNSETEVAAYAERLRGLLLEPMTIGGQELFVSASIGATSSAGGYTGGSEMLRNASVAMYRAKQDSSVGAHFVAGSEQRPQRLRLESELRHALESRQILAYYQPVLDLYERRLFGFEALARWQHPARGVLLPAEFIDLASELGLVAELDLQMLRQTCEELAQLQQLAPLNSLSLSLNLSEDCLRQPGIAARIGELLASNSLPPESLRVEVLERMVQIEPARLTLQSLRDLGLGLYVDDFGTGYSALSRLNTLPLTALKIDREFVREMSRGSGGEKVIGGIVALARNLGLDVIAEGISTAEEAARLSDAGCRYVQGFYFSPAIPFAQALDLAGDAEPFTQQFAEIERLRRHTGARHTNLTLIQGEM